MSGGDDSVNVSPAAGARDNMKEGAAGAQTVYLHLPHGGAHLQARLGFLVDCTIHEQLQEALSGPLDSLALAEMCGSFVTFFSMVNSLALWNGNKRRPSLCKATLEVRQEDVLLNVINTLPSRFSSPRHDISHSLAQVLDWVASEVTERINRRLFLYSTFQMVSVEETTVTVPHRILHHAGRVWNILMFSSTAGDGNHIIRIPAKTHPGTGDAEI